MIKQWKVPYWRSRRYASLAALKRCMEEARNWSLRSFLLYQKVINLSVKHWQWFYRKYKIKNKKLTYNWNTTGAIITLDDKQ